MAAKALAEVIPPETKFQIDDAGQAAVIPDVPKIARAATDLVRALRAWYERADDWTWVWLRWQMWLFIGGATLLLVVPLSYYFFSHAAR